MAAAAVESLQPPPLSLLSLRRPSHDVTPEAQLTRASPFGQPSRTSLEAPLRNGSTLLRTWRANSADAGVDAASKSTARTATDLERAQFNAIAQLSIDLGRDSSSDGASDTNKDNPFTQYARAEEKRRTSSPASSQDVPLSGRLSEDGKPSRIRQVLSPFKWRRNRPGSASEEPSSQKSALSPAEFSDRFDSPEGLASNLSIDEPSAPSRSVDSAMAQLGWFWNSQADAIWGASTSTRANQSHTARPVTREASRPPPAGSRPNRTIPRPATASASTRSSSYDFGHPQLQRLSSGPTSMTLRSWDNYMEAYASGRFDIEDAIALKPTGLPSAEHSWQTSSSNGPSSPGYLRSPMPPFEGARRAAICRSGILELPPHLCRKIDTLSERLKRDLKVATVFVDVLFGDKSYFVLKDHMSLFPAPRQDTMCGHTILNSSRGMTILNRRLDWRFKDNPELAEVGFYSGCTIRSGTGLPFGAVCVIDSQPRETFTRAQKDMVQSVADQVSQMFEANFAEHFQAKMSDMGAAMEMANTRLRQVRRLSLDDSDDHAERVKEFPEIDLTLSAQDHAAMTSIVETMREAIRMDVVAILASRSQLGKTRKSIHSIASSGEPVPCGYERALPLALMSNDVGEQQIACRAYQNEGFEESAHPTFPYTAGPDSPPFTCGLVVPLQISTDAAKDNRDTVVDVEFVLMAASTQTRRVLGVEDLRFLQSLQPSFRSALQRCVNSSADVQATQLAQDIAAAHLPSWNSVQAREQQRKAAQKMSEGDIPLTRSRTTSQSMSANVAPNDGGDAEEIAMTRSLSVPSRHAVGEAGKSYPSPLGLAAQEDNVKSRSPSQITKSPQTGEFYFRIGQRTAAAPAAVAKKIVSTAKAAGSMRPGSSKGLGSRGMVRSSSPLGLSSASWSSSMESLHLSPTFEASEGLSPQDLLSSSGLSKGSSSTIGKSGRPNTTVGDKLSVDHFHGRHRGARHRFCEQCCEDQLLNEEHDLSLRSRAVRWADRRPSSSSLSASIVGDASPLPEGSGGLGIRVSRQTSSQGPLAGALAIGTNDTRDTKGVALTSPTTSERSAMLQWQKTRAQHRDMVDLVGSEADADAQEVIHVEQLDGSRIKSSALHSPSGLPLRSIATSKVSEQPTDGEEAGGLRPRPPKARAAKATAMATAPSSPQRSVKALSTPSKLKHSEFTHF